VLTIALWKANHVWLIFVLVLMWTAFPPLFAAVASTLYIPLTLIALGVIARGSAFAFRKAVTELWQRRMFGAAFAFSSLVTPFFLGAASGGVASGRVPPGLARGNAITAAITVAAVLWGWGAAQYPHVLLPGMTVTQAAAPRATLQAALACVIVGMVLLIPSLTWLFVLFQRSESRFRNPV
jgi:cytochrome bd-type quinol oxidase subunit 2